MRESLRDWLPAEAAERSAVRAPIEEVVAQWSSHWVARGELSLSHWALAAEARADAAWRDCGGGLQVNCSTRAAARLAGLALDARPEQDELNDRDRKLLASLSRRIVDDLAHRVRQRLGAERDVVSPADRRITAVVSEGVDAILQLSIPVPLLTGLCRRTLPTPRAPTTPLASRLAAAAPTTLRLEATLGAVTLSLAEVRDLAVGDILVLDRTVSEPADLSLSRSEAPVARGTLTETEGHVALILQPVE